MTPQPTVILRPSPQRRDRIFTPAALDRLRSAFTVIDLDDDLSEDALDAALPEAFAIIGQPDLPAERLARADQLRAIVNVEGNFFPNIDYPTAFARSIRVLGCGVAYAQPVAEYALALALDLARGISREDRAARHGLERYVADGNADAILLRGAEVGFLGFGNLGRATLPLLAPFRPRVRIFDPWLPDSMILEAGAEPASFADTLASSQFLFVFATVTEQSRHLLDAAALDQLTDGTRLIVVSRAAVLDFDALLPHLASGRIYAGIDVWPNEPIPVDDPYRVVENVIISGHRAGGSRPRSPAIGDLVCDDLELIAAGLPPVRMQVAAPRTGRPLPQPSGGLRPGPAERRSGRQASIKSLTSGRHGRLSMTNTDYGQPNTNAPLAHNYPTGPRTPRPPRPSIPAAVWASPASSSPWSSTWSA